MFDTDSAAELIDKISAAARAESMAIAARLTAIGALDTRRERELAETVYWRTDPFEEVAAEISAALRISRNRAGTLIHHARVLRDKLPQVAARLAAGDIDYRVVRALISRTDNVDSSVWAALDTELAARAHRWMRLSERQLRDRIDQWVIKLDPNGQRVPPNPNEDRFVQIEPASPGRASVWANLDAVDGTALDQRLDALARTVCANDPRSLDQRRADACGPLARMEAQLPCRCGLPDCTASQNRAAADAALVHVLAEESTLQGASDNPGYLRGHGILPAQAVRDLAKTATVKPVRVPVPTGPDSADTDTTDTDTTGPGESDTFPTVSGGPGYRPSTALREFIFWRDLTCRFPGCNAPAQRCDIDHTEPYPAGPTHPSNNKLYCRAHHLLKTFCPGWADRQSPDGTVEFTTPTGHTYTTEPHGAAMFPTLAQSTGNLPEPQPETPHPNRGMKMPKRSHTREQERQERIAEERRFRAEINNDLDVERQYQIWFAEEYGPPPPF
ncbi:hypothetical protein A5740_23720 [Mycobacterium sp. GA-1841]|uniref:HNH endonuclease signature motif containing protein n=1 Tax=Mycobacterium sp. GA-1841 TaxID=1834154 RepID=UPI00096C8B1B|nr:HNH endonuclease signature motif containing protein [Mycobacterium sp. GA-1841]OMC40778.1 hypothetical protein A5740_23720 [Mycobacterium sp. GA-1841]